MTGLTVTIARTMRGWRDYYWVLTCGHELIRARRPSGQEWRRKRTCKRPHGVGLVRSLKRVERLRAERAS